MFCQCVTSFSVATTHVESPSFNVASGRAAAAAVQTAAQSRFWFLGTCLFGGNEQNGWQEDSYSHGSVETHSESGGVVAGKTPSGFSGLVSSEGQTKRPQKPTHRARSPSIHTQNPPPWRRRKKLLLSLDLFVSEKPTTELAGRFNEPVLARDRPSESHTVRRARRLGAARSPAPPSQRCDTPASPRTQTRARALSNLHFDSSILCLCLCASERVIHVRNHISTVVPASFLTFQRLQLCGSDSLPLPLSSAPRLPPSRIKLSLGQSRSLCSPE